MSELPFEKMNRDARQLFNKVKDNYDPLSRLAGDVACHCLALLDHIGKGRKIRKGMNSGPSNAGQNVIQVYTDGSCDNSRTKSGGFATIIVQEGRDDYTINNFVRATTSNRMELFACIKGLEYILENRKVDGVKIKLYSDSEYVVNSINMRWFEDWQKNNWRNAKRKPISNKDLWEELIGYIDKLDVEFNHTAGHAGNHYNELADSLANKKMRELITLIERARYDNISKSNI